MNDFNTVAKTIRDLPGSGIRKFFDIASSFRVNLERGGTMANGIFNIITSLLG